MQFECKCNDLFNNNISSIISPHQSIQNSIIHHYEAIERISKIMDNYHIYVKQIIPNQKINYNIDKRIYTEHDISINHKIHYIGLSENHETIIYMLLYPQFNSINMYDILRDIFFTNFIFTKINDEKYKNVKNVYCSIITLDSTMPIIIDLNSIIKDNIHEIKCFIKELLVNKYYKNHKIIFDFMEYNRELYKSDYLSKIASDKTIKIPKYILNWIEFIDDYILTESNKMKRKEMKNNIQNKNWVCDKLNEKFNLLVNKMFDISISSGWDSDDSE